MAGVIIPNSKNDNVMVGNDKAFNVFFFIWSMFLMIYGVNAALTTK